jgi:hypothetical protein
MNVKFFAQGNNGLTLTGCEPTRSAILRLIVRRVNHSPTPYDQIDGMHLWETFCNLDHINYWFLLYITIIFCYNSITLLPLYMPLVAYNLPFRVEISELQPPFHPFVLCFTIFQRIYMLDLKKSQNKVNCEPYMILLFLYLTERLIDIECIPFECRTTYLTLFKTQFE